MTSGDLATRVALLEERLRTLQAEYRGDMATLAKDIADRNAEAAERSAREADRVARWGWWKIGIVVAAISLATGVILHLMPDR